MSRLCVYCGSNPGFREEYARAAVELARLMSQQGWGLVYGGGSIGLMGILADAVLAEGGEVIGIIPEFLATQEILKANCTELHVTSTMHARKQKMIELADAYIALPGGYGTLEEVLEAITWLQLGLHDRPVGFLNTRDFYGPLFQQFDRLLEEGFITPEHRSLVRLANTPQELLRELERPVSAATRKWLPKEDL